MSLETLLIEIERFHTNTEVYKKLLCDKLKVFITDKNIPLKVRWDAFYESKLGIEHAYIQHFDTIKEGKFKSWVHNPIEGWLHDDRDRGTEITVFDIDETLHYSMENKDVVECVLSHDGPKLFKTIEQADIDAWQEEVLSKFILSYRLDW